MSMDATMQQAEHDARLRELRRGNQEELQLALRGDRHFRKRVVKKARAARKQLAIAPNLHTVRGDMKRAVFDALTRLTGTRPPTWKAARKLAKAVRREERAAERSLHREAAGTPE